MAAARGWRTRLGAPGRSQALTGALGGASDRSLPPAGAGFARRPGRPGQAESPVNLRRITSCTPRANGAAATRRPDTAPRRAKAPLPARNGRHVSARCRGQAAAAPLALETARGGRWQQQGRKNPLPTSPARAPRRRTLPGHQCLPPPRRRGCLRAVDGGRALQRWMTPTRSCASSRTGWLPPRRRLQWELQSATACSVTPSASSMVRPTARRPGPEAPARPLPSLGWRQLGAFPGREGEPAARVRLGAREKRRARRERARSQGAGPTFCRASLRLPPRRRPDFRGPRGGADPEGWSGVCLRGRLLALHALFRRLRAAEPGKGETTDGGGPHGRSLSAPVPALRRPGRPLFL